MPRWTGWPFSPPRHFVMEWIRDNPIAAISLLTAVTALAKVVWDMRMDQRVEKRAMDIARRQAPDVDKALELGNFKQAMEGVNIAQAIMVEEMERLQAEQRQGGADHRQEIDERLAQLGTRLRDLETRIRRIEKRISNVWEEPGDGTPE